MKVRLQGKRHYHIISYVPPSQSPAKLSNSTRLSRFYMNYKDTQVRFDKLTSHDITFVGIIQTARASGLERFPMPYVLTNCHNSLCAVGGTINEDDHMFGLTCAKNTVEFMFHHIRQ